MLGFQNVAIGHNNGVAALRVFSYKNVCIIGILPGQKRLGVIRKRCNMKEVTLKCL